MKTSNKTVAIALSAILTIAATQGIAAAQSIRAAVPGTYTYRDGGTVSTIQLFTNGNATTKIKVGNGVGTVDGGQWNVESGRLILRITSGPHVGFKHLYVFPRDSQGQMYVPNKFFGGTVFDPSGRRVSSQASLTRTSAPVRPSPVYTFDKNFLVVDNRANEWLTFQIQALTDQSGGWQWHTLTYQLPPLRETSLKVGNQYLLAKAVQYSARGSAGSYWAPRNWNCVPRPYQSKVRGVSTMILTPDRTN